MLLIFIALGYVVGSLNGGLLISKYIYKKDIRNYGSGNAGATNATRVLGKKAGLITVLFDVLKVVLVMGIASLYSIKAGALAGFMCCVGHCYPCFAEFKGGKAVASTFGFLFSSALFLTHNWLGFLIPLLVFLACFLKTHIVSLSSLVGIGTAALFAFTQSDFQVLTTTWLLFGLVAYRHKDNITRLKNGTEKKLDLSSKKK